MNIIDAPEYHSGLHRSGWEYVVNALQKIQLDVSIYSVISIITIVDIDSHKYLHNKPWLGFIHHTFYEPSGKYNCKELFNNKIFRISLRYCKGLIVLSNYLRDQVIEELLRLKVNIPVHCILHPTEPSSILFNFKNITVSTRASKISKIIGLPSGAYKKYLNVIHVGCWYRDLYKFYELVVNPNTRKKYVLKVNGMESILPTTKELKAPTPIVTRHQYICRGYNFSDSILHSYLYNTNIVAPKPKPKKDSYIDNLEDNAFSSSMNISIKKNIESIEIINFLSNCEYDKLLSKSVVFLYLMDCSAVNTVIECIIRNTPIILNRHPALEEYLGIDYPGFYDNMYEAGVIVNDDWKLLKIHLFLVNMNKDHLMIDTFISKFMDIFNTIDRAIFDIVDDYQCSICLDSLSFRMLDMISSLEVISLRCDHTYHKNCLDIWCKQNNTCPICRTKIVN